MVNLKKIKSYHSEFAYLFTMKLKTDKEVRYELELRPNEI